MEIEGICTICGKPGKMHTCTMCGFLVCVDCYDSKRKVCKICAVKFR